MAVEIEQGKTLIVKLMSIGSLSPEGNRIVYFELNGQPRQVTIFDRSAEVSVEVAAAKRILPMMRTDWCLHAGESAESDGGARQ